MNAQAWHRVAHAAPLRALLALAAAWPLTARAYRPFDSTDAAVTAQGELEVELGPVGYFVEGSDEHLLAPSAILNWGFADRWEAVLEGRNFIQLGGEVRIPAKPIGHSGRCRSPVPARRSPGA